MRTSRFTVKVSRESRAPQWDSFLAGRAGCLYEQTSLWARVKSIQGWRPVRLVVYHGGQVVGGFQVLNRRVARVGRIGYVSRGPVLCENPKEVVPFLVEQLKETLRRERIHMVIVHPPARHGALLRQMERDGFRPDRLVKMIRATLLIDLSSDLEDILRDMKKDKRKAIRQGLRRGLRVRAGTEADIPVFFDLMRATCERQGVAPNPSDVTFFEELWRVFSPHGYVKLFMVEKEQECIAGAWGICFGNTFRSWKVGWSGRFGNLKPNQVLRWEMIRWAKEQGYAWFDFFGISPSADSSSKEEMPGMDGISTHKLGYGGRVHHFPPAYEYAYSPLLRFAYRALVQNVAGSAPGRAIAARL